MNRETPFGLADLLLANLRPGRSWQIGPGVRNPLKGAHTSIAKANRRTGAPHSHAREIARRTRQEAARG